MTTSSHLLTEIRDANLGYLMLAQRMIRIDRSAAISQLGLNERVADIMEALSDEQIMSLATNSMMVARFRFDDSAILGMLADYSKGRLLGVSPSETACQVEAHA